MTVQKHRKPAFKARRRGKTAVSRRSIPKDVWRGGYVGVFDIPDVDWSGTDTIQTEVDRARKRHRVRMRALDVWLDMKQQGQAWKVDRFIAMIEVTYPRKRNVVPARAAETVKPIIDAGTDAGLWKDDNSDLRCSTVFYQSHEEPRPHWYRLRVYIIPVPENNPQFKIQGSLPPVIQRLWMPDEPRPDWDDGYQITFNVPHPLWITSNFTDSDVKARQSGAYKSDTWGDGSSFGIRQQVESRLRDWAYEIWLRKNYCGYERFIVMVGIGYASGKDADPDNAAETVNAILQAGVMARAWYGLSHEHCRALVYFRSPMEATPRKHDVLLYVFPVPKNFHIANALADAADEAWEVYDRRRK